MGSRVSLKVVAERVGCSRMAVSRVLRSDPHVSEGLRGRIRAVLEELKYRPDPDEMHRMAALRATRRRRGLAVIGVLSMMGERRFEHGPGLSRRLIWKGMEEQAESLGYRLEEFFPVIEKVSPERMRQILVARGIRLVIFSSAEMAGARFDMDLDGLFAVTFGLTLESPQVRHVAVHDHQHSFLGTEHLWREGFRRVGLAHDRGEVWRTYSSHLTGYVSATSRFEGLVHLPPFDLRDGMEGFRVWCREHRPEAIVGRPATLEFLGRLRERPGRVRVPSFVPMKNTLELPGFRHACVRTHIEEVGSSTVASVHGLYIANASGPSVSPQSLMIDGTWHAGEGIHGRDGW